MSLDFNLTLNISFGKLVETLHDYVWPGEDEEEIEQ